MLSRAGGEPIVATHPDGTLLIGTHAGTTHFFTPAAANATSAAFAQHYTGQTYYYWSNDLGHSWHFVPRATLPDNAMGSGFSDPDFAIDSTGQVFTSEINLVNVAMSKSTTSGKSYGLQNFFAEDITDRQWSAAGPENVLYLVGNPSEGGTFPNDPVGHGSHTIYRSTDGGKTFSNGVDDSGGLGDIVFDMSTKTLFEAHYGGGALQIAAFRKALDPVATVALAPTLADARHYRHHRQPWPLPYPISYLHNYGPGPAPATFAFYGAAL